MLKALEEVDELIVGIGSAEDSHTDEDPFTAGERVEMVLRASEEAKVRGRVIPIPIRDLDRYAVWVSHVVSLVPSFDVVYSNNPLTISLFGEAGHTVRSTTLVDRTHLSGANIRKMMTKGSEWKDLVPASVYEYIKSLRGEERLKGG